MDRPRELLSSVHGNRQSFDTHGFVRSREGWEHRSPPTAYNDGIPNQSHMTNSTKPWQRGPFGFYAHNDLKTSDYHTRLDGQRHIALFGIVGQNTETNFLQDAFIERRLITLNERWQVERDTEGQSRCSSYHRQGSPYKSCETALVCFSAIYADFYAKPAHEIAPT